MSRHSLVSLCLAVASAFGGSGPTFAIDDPTLFAQLANVGAWPATDGTYVVWREGTISGYLAGAQVGGEHLAIGVPGHLGTLGGRPVIDDGITVWQTTPLKAPEAERKSADIWATHLATGEYFAVATTPAHEVAPAISGSWVVWLEYPVLLDSSQDRLMLRDIGAMTSPITLARSNGGRLAEAVIHGSRVVWSEVWSSGGAATRWQLRQASAAGDVPRVLAEGAGTAPASLSLAGDLLTFFFERHVVALDLATGVQRAIAPGPTVGLATDGRYVFWGREIPGVDRPPGSLNRVDLYGFDVTTGQEFVIRADGAANGWPQAGGGMLVWSRTSMSSGPPSTAVHLVRIDDLPPRFFPETGHSLAFNFKRYWEANGGLPVFGYPLTDVFDERDADTGRSLTVQYLERQRFEYHPELAGTPYEVSLGRLGAEDAARREDLRGLWAFNPVAPDTDHPSGCAYLPDARHRLCGEFRPYWEGHGLDLGDESVSFRESLALFGYPITEEFIDPRTGLITQYFERAVFEYHPDLPIGQRVLLRRLGAERLATS